MFKIQPNNTHMFKKKKMLSRYIASVFILFITGCTSVGIQKLAPFTTDGCSSFPDGTIADNELWLECCVDHDYAYWKGGTYEQREEVDMTLRECVAEVEKNVALLMHAGVRIGGTPLLPTTFRWGYGWSSPRPYGELSQEELVLVKQEQVEHLEATKKEE